MFRGLWILGITVLVTGLGLGVAPSTAHTWYVAPNASAGGDGSIGNPWQLPTALQQPASVQPGDTIYLRGGTYTGSFTSWLAGTPTAPIYVSAYPGERPTLDRASSARCDCGALVINGHDTWYTGLDVTNSDPARVNPEYRGNGVIIYGPRTRLINCTVHDHENGVALWKEAVGAELYGNVIYNNGYTDGTGRGYGHAIYTDNDTGMKRIAANIGLNSFNYVLHAYEEASVVRGYKVEGNTFANAGEYAGQETGSTILFGGVTHTVDNIIVSGNYTYEREPRVDAYGTEYGYRYPGTNGMVTIQNNYFVGGQSGAALAEWDTLTFTGNTLVGWRKMVTLRTQLAVGHLWDANEYIGGDGAPFVYGGAGMTYNEWKAATRYDAGSTFTPRLPTANRVFVRPNEYQAGRANVTVYNWQGATSQSVSMAGVLMRGDSYIVLNAADPLGAPLATGVYNGTSILLPLAGLRGAAPVGWSAPTQDAAFAVFIVVRKG